VFCIEQSIANKIAEQQKLSCPMMEAFFSAGEKEILKFEQILHDDVYSRTGSHHVANAIIFLLPLFLESDAISRFLEKEGTPELRRVLPVVSSAEYAVQLAQEVVPGMSSREVVMFYDELKHYHLHLFPDSYTSAKKSEVVLDFQMETLLRSYIRPPFIRVYRDEAVPDLPEVQEITAEQIRAAAVDVTRHLIRRYGIKPQELK